MSATREPSDRAFRLLQGWGLLVAGLTLATGLWLTVEGAQVFLGAVADPFDRKVFAALNLGIPGCLGGALIAWLAGQGRPWDGFRVAAVVLAALNLATILAWGVLDLVKSGAIRF
ncbi:MAG: hypothetical protein RLZZ550_103 [Verrucomicrobiota bacterium]